MNIAMVSNHFGKITQPIRGIYDKGAGFIISKTPAPLRLFIVQNLGLRSFVIGIGIISILYFGLLSYVNSYRENTITTLEKKLSFIDVSVEEESIYHKNQSSPEKTQQPHNIAGKAIKKVDGLYQKTSIGYLPIIRSSDYLTSFRAYQKQFNFDAIGQKPLVSFVVNDFGLSKKKSEYALQHLPPEVTFILSPYAESPQSWINRAYAKGHEVWLSLPIQNKKGLDQGRNTLFHHTPLHEKRSALHATLSSVYGYVGVAAFTDDSLKNASGDYGEIADEIYMRGLGFMELNSAASHLSIKSKAMVKSAPYLQANQTLISVQTPGYSFSDLEKNVREQDHIIALVPPLPNTVKQLDQWIKKVAQSSYVIAPVSAIYDLPLHRNKEAINIQKAPGALRDNDHIEPIEIQPHHNNGHH